jgi:ubiquilin
MTLTLTIRLSTSARFTLPAAGSSPITPSTTILQVKELISQHDDSGRVEVARQRLIYKGRILSENDKTLAEYGINEATSGETVLYLVKGSGGAAPSTSVPAATTTPAPPPPTSSSNPANPFAMFDQMGAGGGGGGMPDLQQMQQQLQQNPEFMSQMMNNPMVQSLMSNPDFMSNMMESNPQMQQVLNSNPELRQALRDPELMRRSMEMMRDPSMMREMMRNQDLAMSQIENMPGGYNALRRMYEDVQVPMMDAMSGGSEGNNGGAQQQSRGTNDSGAQNQAMPNPWGSPSPSGGGANTNASNVGAGNAANLFNPFAMPNMGAGAAGAANPWANPAGAGSTQQLEATIQMLENPIMRQMMDQMMRYVRESISVLVSGRHLHS